MGKMRARATDPDTSHAAAEKVDGRKVMALVVKALLDHGPMHTDEIAAVLGKRLVSVSPAMAPLERMGVVVRCGRKVYQPTGCSRIVWAVDPLQ